MNEDELNKMIDTLTGAQDLLVRASEKHLITITVLRAKIKDLEYELEDLRGHMKLKDSLNEAYEAEISEFEKELKKHQGAET
jgi:broad-specificity NMP kinase